VRVDVHVVARRGNATDAAGFAAVAALQHLRRNPVTTERSGMTADGDVEASPLCAVTPLDETADAAPVPLVRVPLSVTVALFGGGPDATDYATDDLLHYHAVFDPSDQEELAATASVVLSFDRHDRLLGLDKLGGAAIDHEVLLDATADARRRAKEVHDVLRAELLKADRQWLDDRVASLRRAAAGDAGSAAASGGGGGGGGGAAAAAAAPTDSSLGGGGAALPPAAVVQQ